MQGQGQILSLSGLHSLTLVLAVYLDVPTSSRISQLSPRSCSQSAEHLRPLRALPSPWNSFLSPVSVLTRIL